MKSRTKTSVGIDIGSRRISAALVEKTSRGVSVVATTSADLPDADSQRPGVRARAISRVYRKLGRHAKARSSEVALTVSSDSVIMRLLDMPRPMPANVSEFVEAELNQYVALSGRRRQADFCGIGGSATQRRLLAVAADAEEMRDTLRACRTAGITVNSVEPAALAYARAFLACDKDARYSNSILIAMLDASNLALCLFCKGTLDFVRTRAVPDGMDSANRLGAWLTEELNVVLQYHRAAASETDADVQVRLVVHDAAYDKSDIAASFAPDAKSSEVIDSREPIGALWDSADGASASPSVMAVGAALKLLDMEGDELRIDLTPREVILARSSSKRLLIAANVAAVVFLAVFLAVQFLTRTTDAMNRRIGETRLSSQLYTMSAKVAQDRYLDQEISRIQAQLAGLNAVRAKRQADWPTLLNGIGQSAMPGICVTHLACGDGRSVSLKGQAVSYEHVEMLMLRLDRQGFFESVRLARVERCQDENAIVEYEIECTLKSRKQESFRDDRSQS